MNYIIFNFGCFYLSVFPFALTIAPVLSVVANFICNKDVCNCGVIEIKERFSLFLLTFYYNHCIRFSYWPQINAGKRKGNNLSDATRAYRVNTEYTPHKS